MTSRLLLPLATVCGVIYLVTWAASSPLESPRHVDMTAAGSVQDTVREVDAYFTSRWSSNGIEPVAAADDLEVLRRLSLTLHGTVPSLEEIREFEADSAADRLDRWVVRMLDDERFATYFSERLARSLVGTENGPFIIYRRDRLVEWLSRQLQADRPWSAIARDVISGQGLWTGTPETNFVTVAVANGELDRNKLAGRTVRAFLGQRIDCAQCHDHPFDEWKQTDFEGLAAFYSQTGLTLAGVEDKDGDLFRLASDFIKEFDEVQDDSRGNRRVSGALRNAFKSAGYPLREHVSFETIQSGMLWLVREGPKPPEPVDPTDASPPDRKDIFAERYVIRRDGDELQVSDYTREHVIHDEMLGEIRVSEPVVPFHAESLRNDGLRRVRLARWITHPENRRFDRAIANRVWGLMFGRPFHGPVDDLPDPPDGAEPDLLDILGSDFRAHDDSLHRLIRVIAGSRVFRLASTTDVVSRGEYAVQQMDWAVFPLIRLRPEQVIGAMLQSAYIRTIDQNSHLFVRAFRFFNERDFVQQYGDAGADELDERGGTLPQALLRMNGSFTRETTKTSPFSAAGRITDLSPSDEALIENCFLVCLTRRPNDEELEHFLGQFRGTTGEERNEIAQDLYWGLFNSPEFSWNH